MRISTKIISGYGILMAMILGLTTFQMTKIHRMQRIINDLAQNFSTSEASLNRVDNVLEMMRELDFLDSLAQRFFAIADTDYAERMRDEMSVFEGLLKDAEASASTQGMREAIGRLRRSWNEFSAELSRQWAVLLSDDRDAPSAMLIDHLEELISLTNNVYQVARTDIHTQADISARTGKMAETYSWIIASVAVLLGILVSLLIVQSISSPLNQLTQGTRALTEGKFYYRLDTSRNDEFGHLAKDFNTMTLRLNELDQMKRDFVSHVSHELKAPLASMLETIQLMLDEIPGPLTMKQRRLLELNSASGGRLSAMIDNLLDLSRMEAGVIEYELKSTDLNGLVRTAVAELQAQAGERGLSIVTEIPEQPVVVECDGDRILQIIRNLLGNAIKFSPPGKEIRLCVTSEREVPAGMPGFWREKCSFPGDGKGLALICVADSGPGVPDGHKLRIFEKFHQVRQGKKVPGQGTGLGLAISRTIAEAHRGAIWVEDNPGGGSIFRLALPPGDSGNKVTYRASSPI